MAARQQKTISLVVAPVRAASGRPPYAQRSKHDLLMDLPCQTGKPRGLKTEFSFDACCNSEKCFAVNKNRKCAQGPWVKARGCKANVQISSENVPRDPRARPRHRERTKLPPYAARPVQPEVKMKGKLLGKRPLWSPRGSGFSDFGQSRGAQGSTF